MGKLILAIIYFPFLIPKALEKIKRTKEIATAPETAYQWTNYFRVGPKIRGLNINFQSSQVKSEIVSLLKELAKAPPKTVLEIGTATAGTLFMFTQVSQPDAEIISIDLPFGRYGAGYLKYRIPLIKAFANKNQKMHLLRCDSHEAKTIEKLKEILKGKTIDFLFIDGDHSYEGVKADFENYSPLVTPGGMIAFHDILPNDFDNSFGTQLFWKEIRNNYESQELIRENPDNTGCGIGLIKTPKIK